MVRSNEKSRITEQERQELRAVYAENKKQLRIAIKNDKRLAWQEICEAADLDVWGKGYQIVREKLSKPIKVDLSTDNKIKEAETLFPRGPIQNWDDWMRGVEITDISPIIEREIREAGGKLKKRKAAGPDEIQPEAVIVATEVCGRHGMEVYNALLTNRQFPTIWKEANLVLLEKPRKPGSEIKYRPLCLFNTTGKLFEHIAYT